MPVHSISADSLVSGLPAGPDAARNWCALLEAGGILYFPQTPLPIPEEDIGFLLGRRQTGSRLHKNIAYKPARDVLSGFDEKTASPEERAQLHDVMRRYSASVAGFLAKFLAPYSQRWQLDYASFRPLEEEGRDLSLRRRNDLLHTDAFPTRPTHGARILRFFHNIHPDRGRDWMVTDPFARIVKRFTPSKIPLPAPDSSLKRAGRRLVKTAGLGKILPRLKRTPYDEFMMQLHDTMKEDAEFQLTCHKERVSFPAGSSWMVYTETVPHAVLGGQFALEQTFLVDPRAMVVPESSPLAILENLAGARLA